MTYNSSTFNRFRENAQILIKFKSFFIENFFC